MYYIHFKLVYAQHKMIYYKNMTSMKKLLPFGAVYSDVKRPDFLKKKLFINEPFLVDKMIQILPVFRPSSPRQRNAI